MKPHPRARGMRDCRARMPLMYIERKLYELPATTEVDGSPPAPNCPPGPDGQRGNFGSVGRTL
eukprot:7518289-Pyramimonas_sp.AAC.1